MIPKLNTWYRFKCAPNLNLNEKAFKLTKIKVQLRWFREDYLENVYGWQLYKHESLCFDRPCRKIKYDMERIPDHKPSRLTGYLYRNPIEEITDYREIEALEKMVIKKEIALADREKADKEAKLIKCHEEYKAYRKALNLNGVTLKDLVKDK